MPKRVPNIQIPAALSKKNEFNYLQDTVSTADFLQSQPDTYLWTIPFQDYKIKLDSFTRCAPLNLPTFGRVTVSHRAFFVKFKDIFDGWNEAYTRTLKIHPHTMNSSTYPVTANTVTPWFSVYDLCQFIKNTSSIAGTATTGYDITLRDTSTTPPTQSMWLFTHRGRIFYKVLNGLGYTVVPDQNSTLRFTALPLLAYCKIMCEYFYPSNWKNNTIYTNMISLLESFKGYQTSYQLKDKEFATIAEFLENCNGYDQDYFVSSYQTATQQNDNPFAAETITGNDSLDNVTIPTTGSPTMYGNVNQITTSIIDLLQRVTSYLKINALAGADAFERLYAMFGYRSDSGRAIYFGSDEYTLQIGDIQSTADTTSASLGSYAGKGVGGSADRYFEFKNSGDCGIIIIVKTITPHIGYVQGFDRHNLQVNILDFWHPLFDAQGDQEISKGEICSQPINGGTYLTATNIQSVFGRIPRFAHYKVGHDLCIGDFTLGSRNTGLNAWHLFREFGYRTSLPSTSLTFANASDSAQYLRIFQMNGAKEPYEPFNCVSNYTIQTYAPMRKLWDDTILDQIEHQDNGKTGDFQPGGSKLY